MSGRAGGPVDMALDQAAGTSLAEALYAPGDLPPFDNSAMDGYALNTADLRGDPPYRLPLDGTTLAGEAPPPLTPGHARRITTGAALPLQAPLGTDFVVAGLVDSNGSVLASLVERRANPGNNFLLTGPVFAVDMNLQRIQVGNQWVDYAGVGFNNCPSSPPPVGSSVSLRSTAVASFE